MLSGQGFAHVIRLVLFSLMSLSLVLAAAGSEAFASLWFSSASTQGTAVIDRFPLPAVVEIHPNALQKDGTGMYVTAYIELPDGSDVGDIDITTVRMCLGSGIVPCSEGIPAEDHPSTVGDYDHDGTPDRMLKFLRAQVISLVEAFPPRTPIPITVSGTVGSDKFVGGDVIELVP